ncbi:MAG: hypothetical protein U9R48_00600 [Chloroflexota bacterium]|nr:hypothetical protein [Chloroflexota bacterium]
MPGFRKLKTQQEAFWRDEYQVSEEDLDLITGLILDEGTPQSLDVLTSAVILHHFHQEQEEVLRQAEKGVIYRPADEYRVGDELVFSALDFAVGEVVGVREGDNPRYEPFNVVRVDFGGEEREFASGFGHVHPLNRPVEELISGTGEEMDEAELLRLFEHYVACALEPALEENKDFMRFGDSWFLSALLPEIHVGHLNLAEAIIYEAGEPVRAEEMVEDLELEGGSVDAQIFALNRALGEDERFDDVSLDDAPAWYLRALEPEAIYERPRVHEVGYGAEGGEYVGLTMLDMIEEIGDELDDVETIILEEVSDIHFEVVFPHLQAGTMPATRQFMRHLPSDTGHHFSVTFVDGSTKEHMKVWVVPEEGYVCGLGDWYAQMGMCVGGRVTVSALEDPLTFKISVTPQRGRGSNWVRSVSVDNERLVLQMQRANIAVDCDPNMMVNIPNPQEIVRLMERTAESDPPLGSLVRTAIRELVKLSSRGVVHAKAIYSVVNLLRRTGAVPIFSELTRNACFDPVGEGFWAYDSELEGEVYSDPEEMRERPLSKQEDVLRDQVVQYLGR